MIEIYLLEQLTAFAKCGSFSKAAEELHMTQPALTRSMKKLESDLGVTLFIREGKKVSLNETGKFAVTLAEGLLRQNEDMEDRIRSYDKSLNSIVLGSCAPFPIYSIMPLLTDHYSGMRISSEIVSDEDLLKGLDDRTYQLAVVRDNIRSDKYFCQRYISERLYLTVPESHRLAGRKALTFADLKGEKILLQGSIGFWMDMTVRNLTDTELLIQTDASSLRTVIDATELPFFNTDRMIEMYGHEPDRISIPIDEEEAEATFYIACLFSEKEKYSSFMSSIRSEIITGRQ